MKADVTTLFREMEKEHYWSAVQCRFLERRSLSEMCAPLYAAYSESSFSGARRERSSKIGSVSFSEVALRFLMSHVQVL